MKNNLLVLFLSLFALTLSAGKEVIFVDQNATAITTIHQSPLTSQPTYNLRGERVNGSYRGIVIRNGKKYVVK